MHGPLHHRCRHDRVVRPVGLLCRRLVVAVAVVAAAAVAAAAVAAAGVAAAAVVAAGVVVGCSFSVMNHH